MPEAWYNRNEYRQCLRCAMHNKNTEGKVDVMGIKVGVDIGVASVGWAVVDDEYAVLESGVNLFSEAACSVLRPI